MTDRPQVPVTGPGPGASDEDDKLARGRTSRRMDSIGEGQGERAYPRLPPEIDESSDSQAQGVREVIRQAHDDLRDGLKDTSYRPETDRAYEMQKGPGADGTAPAPGDRSGAGLHKTDAARGPGDERSATSQADGRGHASDTIAGDADARRQRAQREQRPPPGDQA